MNNGNRIKRTSEELFKSFQEQVDFINNAAILYDSGNLQAIKMATPALRNLFYQQKIGPILIDLIKDTDKNRFLSTCANDIDDLTMYSGPVSEDFVIAENEIKASCFPNCYTHNFHERFIPFDLWWNENLLIYGDNRFSRCDLVRFVANQDGGAHVCG